MSSSLTSPEQLSELARLAVAVAEECPEPYRTPCFEIVLRFLLASRWPSEPKGTTPDEHAGIPSFLARNGVDKAMLERVIDLASGSILVRELGKSNADVVRKLAILMAIAEALRTGEPIVRKEALVEEAKHWSAYDSSNFARYLKNASYDGKRVFSITNSGDLRLTKPGEDYAAALVKELAAGGSASE